MTDFTEYEGKNVDQALETASRDLNQAIENLTYDVISYGSSGIFGLVGVKKAKIRVRIGSENTTKIERDAKLEAQDLVKSTFAEEGPIEKEAPRSVEAVQSPEIEQAIEQAIADGQKALERLVGFLSEGSQVQAERRNGRVIYKVDGGNSALLIGKRGQTLEAIQYLIEKIINKNNENRIRILVDIEGYLGARKANLQKLANKMAEKAQKTNKPVTIGQMNAYDRRIVHLHLKENQAVRTQSIGEGYYRKLLILPKRKRRKQPSADAS